MTSVVLRDFLAATEWRPSARMRTVAVPVDVSIEVRIRAEPLRHPPSFAISGRQQVARSRGTAAGSLAPNLPPRRA
jgi:hypothetical protein